MTKEGPMSPTAETKDQQVDLLGDSIEMNSSIIDFTGKFPF